MYNNNMYNKLAIITDCKNLRGRFKNNKLSFK